MQVCRVKQCAVRCGYGVSRPAAEFFFSSFCANAPHFARFGAFLCQSCQIYAKAGDNRTRRTLNGRAIMLY